MQMQQHSEIIELLEDSTESHLATALYLVPDENMDAIAKMITGMRQEGKRRAVIRLAVVQDVANILDGKEANHSKQYMNR